MKKITLSAFLLMGCLFANAQTITQSTSLTVMESNTLSCNGGGLATADNSYFRFFKLAEDHDITAAYTVTTVNFGIETLAHETPGSQPIMVKLYAATATFPTGFTTMAGYTLIANQTFDVPDQDLGLFAANITGIVPAGSNLVVEVSYLGDEAGTFILFLGTNDDGESRPTYIMSADCAINEPKTVQAATGSATNHLVMSVVGTTTAGVEENALTAVAVHPNPTNGLVNIQMPNDMVVNSATITDVTGKIMNVNVNANTVNISNYASGVYFLNIITDMGNVTRKIIKE